MSNPPERRAEDDAVGSETPAPTDGPVESATADASDAGSDGAGDDSDHVGDEPDADGGAGESPADALASGAQSGVETVSAAVITVASHRTMEDDPAGDAVVAALEDLGHDVATRDLIRNDYDGAQSEVARLVKREDVEAIVATGGTGVAPEDATIEAVEPLFDKELPGFGEAFRRRSAERLGSRVVSTRAAAGVADGVPVFCLPDGEAAARVGAAELVAPEVGDIVAQANPAHGDEGEEADEGADEGADEEVGEGAGEG